MEKLNFWETIRAEIREAKNAQSEYNKQVSQINKRLYYLPVIIHTVILSGIVSILFSIVRFSGYVTGQSEEKLQVAYSCPIAHCPVVKECGTTELPQTGAF